MRSSSPCAISNLSCIVLDEEWTYWRLLGTSVSPNLNDGYTKALWWSFLGTMRDERGKTREYEVFHGEHEEENAKKGILDPIFRNRLKNRSKLLLGHS